MGKIAKLFPSIFPNFPSRLPIIFLIVFICHALPSPDVHSAQVMLEWNANTSPGITGYKVYYGRASGSYSIAVDVGNVTSYILSNLQDGATYYFNITAYNNSGEESDYTNELSNSTQTTCTFTISPTSKLIGESGGAGTVSLTTQAGCAWTAVSNASWILITSNGSGFGSATVNYSVSPQGAPSKSPRGTITIAGQTFKITQGKPKIYFTTEPLPPENKWEVLNSERRF